MQMLQKYKKRKICEGKYRMVNLLPKKNDINYLV